MFIFCISITGVPTIGNNQSIKSKKKGDSGQGKFSHLPLKFQLLQWNMTKSTLATLYSMKEISIISFKNFGHPVLNFLFSSDGRMTMTPPTLPLTALLTVASPTQQFLIMPLDYLLWVTRTMIMVWDKLLSTTVTLGTSSLTSTAIVSKQGGLKLIATTEFVEMNLPFQCAE